VIQVINSRAKPGRYVTRFVLISWWQIFTREPNNS